MHNKEAVFNYWQCGKQQQLLHALTANNIKNHGHEISRFECTNGKLSDQGTIEALMLYGTSMVIAPYFAKLENQYFVPLLLQIELNPAGKFVSKEHVALPIIPHAVVEPAAIQPISLGLLDNFENFIVMEPPEWLENRAALTWNRQLNYAEQMLDTVCDSWREDLQKTGYVLQNSSLIFPLAKIYQQTAMALNILDNNKKIETIAAERHSGKSTFAKQTIVNAWIDAAVKETAPPRYVWLEYGKELQFASIFECLDTGQLRQSETVSGDLPRLQAVLREQYATYNQGKQVITNWREVADRVRLKYADKGGIQVRLNQLHNNLKDAKAHKRHLQVLYSIWMRQVELISSWWRMLDFIPVMKQQRLRRLHRFFKQNFANDSFNGVNIAGLKQRQLEDILLEKMRRAENSERFVADALHQAENDLHQENLIRDKCVQWCEANHVDMNNIESLWGQLAITAQQYWHANFNTNPELWQEFKKPPQQIDLLLVEHAEYVSPMQAAELFAISKRIIVMGNNDFICIPRFSTQIDYELTQHFELVANDADFEDLQFEGILASLGNMWNLVLQDNEPDRYLTKYPLLQITYEYFDVRTPSEAYLGSRVNLGVLDAVLDWLNRNATLRSKVVIYTCFGGQATLLNEKLRSTFFAQVPIRMVQEPCFEKSAVSLFVPVYTAEDSGPYVFDRGAEMLANLRANTQQRLVVIGDMRIFKPELHSATGNFAKELFKYKPQTKELKITEEASSV